MRVTAHRRDNSFIRVQVQAAPKGGTNPQR